MNYKFKFLLLVFFILISGLKTFSQIKDSINPELLNRKWTAKWITCPEILGNEYGVYLFRKEITLNSKPKNFLIHISADNRYKLCVNEEYVGNGPARGHLLKWNFESIDIASYLKPGKNIISAIVWNFAEYSPLAQISGQTGFILQGNTSAEAMINTNTSWSVFNDKAYQPLPVKINQYYAAGAGEEFDCEKHPWNWMEVDFNASDWKKAKENEDGKPVNCMGEWGSPSLHLLKEREIPFMEEKKQRFLRIRRCDAPDFNEAFLTGQEAHMVPAHSKVKILFDQNCLTNAYPVLIFSKGKKSKIKLTYAESLFNEKSEKGNRNDIENKKIIGMQDIIFCDGGDNRTFQTLWWRTFRYVEMEIETADEPLILKNFYSIFTAYPFKEKAAFKCDNPLLTNIWEVGWRTQRLCSGETFFDCPYYEQLQYIGDTRIQALISSYVSGDSRLVRNALVSMHDSRLPFGITQSRYPCNQIQIIPTFSLVWVAMVYDYWMMNNDKSFVKTMIPGIMETLNWYESRIDTSGMLGQVDWWNFVDWVDYKNWDNGNPPAIHNGNSSIVSLQFVYTIEKAAVLLSAFEMKEEALRLTKLAESIKTAVYKKCFDVTKGLIADSPEKKTYSQHANVLAITTNTFPEGNKAKAMNALLNDKDIAQCTLYFRFYLIEALERTGQADKFISTLTPWKQMLENGLTTFAEQPDPTRSDCHAWSASPVYYFLSLICGIKPNEPGFKSVRIEPHLGSLQNIEGSMPHPLGTIKVALKKDKQNHLSGEIILPEHLTGIFIGNGERKPLNGGINQIK
jgi:alpha-L-rhamnosidase